MSFRPSPRDRPTVTRFGSSLSVQTWVLSPGSTSICKILVVGGSTKILIPPSYSRRFLFSLSFFPTDLFYGTPDGVKSSENLLLLVSSHSLSSIVLTSFSPFTHLLNWFHVISSWYLMKKFKILSLNISLPYLWFLYD